MTLQTLVDEKQLLVFDLADEGYRVEIISVREIIRRAGNYQYTQGRTSLNVSLTHGAV